MKYRFILFLILLVSLRVSAQSNYQPSNSNVQVSSQLMEAMVYDPAFSMLSDQLVSQQNLKAEQYWKNFLRTENSDAEAWLNYYKSVRFRAQDAEQENRLRARLDSIDTQMKKNVAGTWQQLLVYYWNGNHDLSRKASIEQAYQLQPHDGYLLRQLIACKLIAGEKNKSQQYAAEWQNSGQVYSGYSNYAYNVLQSLAQNCILITNGEFDTYPILNQQAKGVRTDAGILSLALAKKPANRAQLFRNLGLLLPANDSISDFDAAYISRIAAANPGKKIYLASTVPGKLISGLQSSLYLTGLAFRYSSESPVDNLLFLRDNVGTKMNPMYYSILSTDPPAIIHLKMNYVLPLAMAAEQYALAGNMKRAEELRTAAKRIGTANGKSDEVNAIISNH